MTENQSPLRVIIVDDEPLGRATLRGLLSADSEVEIVAECANGVEAVAAVRKEKPTVVFLDIQMPGMTGFEVVEELEDEPLPIIVFVTAFDQFALKAFDVNAVDYLLKPFDDERFATSLERVKERAKESQLANGGEQVFDAMQMIHGATGGEKKKLSIRSEGRVQLVDVDDITWIEAADQYVQVHTESDVYLMRESMTKLERDLDSNRFLRVHRSAIVALDRVQLLESASGGGGRLRIAGDTWVPVSRSRVARVRARLR